jgi:hypothetical protein
MGQVRNNAPPAWDLKGQIWPLLKMFKRKILMLLVLAALGGLAGLLVPTQYYGSQLQIYPQIVAPAGLAIESFTRDNLFSRFTERSGESHVFLRFTGQAKSGQAPGQLLTEFEKSIAGLSWARQELTPSQWLAQYMEQLPSRESSGVDDGRLRLILSAILEKGQLQQFIKGMTVQEVQALVAEDLKEDVTPQSLSELHLALELLPDSAPGLAFAGMAGDKGKFLQLLSHGDLRIVIYKSPDTPGPKAICHALAFGDAGKARLAVLAETLR